MRRDSHKGKAAFTLIELLVVVSIIAILAALLLPAINRSKARARRIACVSDLKQIGIAFQMFAHDHHSGFPMQTSVADGGSLEYVQAGESINGTFYFSYRHFQPLASDLVQTKVLVCPTDLDRQAAANFNLLQNSNISYFVGVDSTYDQPMSVLAGDRNITNDARATASLVRGAYGLRWTSEMHFFQGNVLFADSHVQEMNNVRLELPSAVGGNGANTAFFLPAVPASPAAAGAGSGPRPLPAGTLPGNGGQSPPTTADPGRNNLTPPAPSSPSTPAMPDRGIGSRTTSRDGAGDTSQEHGVDDKNSITVTNEPTSAAAPAADDEPEPPLVWLMGTARAEMARPGSWLLLILLVAAIALYFYTRKKIRDRIRRQGGD